MGYSRKKIQKQGLKTYLFEKSPGIFVTLSGFLPLRGWGFWFKRIQGEKKENSRQKSFFHIILNEVLKICEK